ncbi:peptidoglycan-binding protein LysM [Pseudomonas sp. F1_0610]|uniref:peptidoglycan-binding protein LysM n=1 Tax=Pseudomonas sp. F1_0610 TaxID=3114284 RepID=UPI0039C1A805
MGLINFVQAAGAALWENIQGKEAHAAEKLHEHIAMSGLGNPDIAITVEGSVIRVVGHVKTQEEKEKILLALGNVAGISSIEEQIAVVEPSKGARFVTVEKGHTLSAIAKEQYGDANAYMRIFEANKPLLKDPNKIYPGQVLRIPV